jgi:hypothetical protein
MLQNNGGILEECLRMIFFPSNDMNYEVIPLRKVPNIYSKLYWNSQTERIEHYVLK